MSFVLSTNIKSSITIADVLGTYGGGASSLCAFDGEVGCLVNGSSFKAADVHFATPAAIRIGSQIAGVVGTYDGGAAISILEPVGRDDKVAIGGSFVITFMVFNPSGPAGTVELFYRSSPITTGCSGNPAANGWTSIISGLDENLTNHSWDSLAQGTYSICAKFDNVNEQVYSLSSGTIVVNNDRLVFVTSTRYLGGSIAGDLNNADTYCRNRALAANLPFPNSFKALISNSTTDAIDRVNIGDAVYNTLGNIVGTSATFWTSTHSDIIYTEKMDQATYYAWTGTNSAGLRSGNNCSDWTSSASSGLAADMGLQGYANVTGDQWVNGLEYSCNDSVTGFYCLGEK